jgi:hypothetical protein
MVLFFETLNRLLRYVYREKISFSKLFRLNSQNIKHKQVLVAVDFVFFR